MSLLDDTGELDLQDNDFADIDSLEYGYRCKICSVDPERGSDRFDDSYFFKYLNQLRKENLSSDVVLQLAYSIYIYNAAVQYEKIFDEGIFFLQFLNQKQACKSRERQCELSLNDFLKLYQVHLKLCDSDLYYYASSPTAPIRYSLITNEFLKSVAREFIYGVRDITDIACEKYIKCKKNRSSVICLSEYFSDCPHVTSFSINKDLVISSKVIRNNGLLQDNDSEDEVCKKVLIRFKCTDIVGAEYCFKVAIPADIKFYTGNSRLYDFDKELSLSVGYARL